MAEERKGRKRTRLEGISVSSNWGAERQRSPGGHREAGAWGSVRLQDRAEGQEGQGAEKDAVWLSRQCLGRRRRGREGSSRGDGARLLITGEFLTWGGSGELSRPREPKKGFSPSRQGGRGVGSRWRADSG